MSLCVSAKVSLSVSDTHTHTPQLLEKDFSKKEPKLEILCKPSEAHFKLPDLWA